MTRNEIIFFEKLTNNILLHSKQNVNYENGCIMLLFALTYLTLVL